MKPSTFSSSGELSESQGLNDFLNAHSTKDEAKALNKNRPQPALAQPMNPRHNDLVNYYPPSSFGNTYGMPYQGMGMMNPGAEYYNYDDEDFEEYGEEGYMEYEEERDPYDFEIDFGPTKKKNQVKVLDKSYEERKKALQKKRDQKKKTKEEEIKKKEEEEKRLKIEQAITKEQSKSRKSLIEEKRMSTKISDKMNFDIADALNESKSQKSQISVSIEKSITEEDDDEEYQEKKPEVYDPTEMMKYMGKSSLLESQSQSQIPNVEGNPSEINNNTSKFTTSNNNPNTSEKFTTNNNISEKFNNNKNMPDNPTKEVSDSYDVSQTNEYLRKSLEMKELQSKSEEEEEKENVPKLQVSTPTGGFESLGKKNYNNEKNKETVEKNIASQENNTLSLKPGNSNQQPDTLSKHESFNTFAADNSMKLPKTNEVQETSSIHHFSQTQTKAMSKNGDLIENKLFEMKLGHKTEELEVANQRIEAYQTELEELVKQLEISERKAMQLELENKNLKFSSESKMRVMQEKAVFIDKITETRLTQELSEQFSLEKEGLMLEIEKLKNEICYFKSQNETFFQLKRDMKTLETRKIALESENSHLKRELLEYQELIKDPIVQRRALRKNSKLNSDEDSDFLREFEFQELLIKGYQKENERNLLVIKDLKEEIESLTGKVFKKETAIVDLKGKFARIQKANLLTEDSKIDVMKGMINPEVLVDMEELKDLRRRLIETLEKNKILKAEIEREQQEKKGLEEKQQQMKYLLQINEQQMKELNEKHSTFEEFKRKLEEQVKRKEDEIQKLEEEVGLSKRNMEEMKKFKDENKELINKVKVFEREQELHRMKPESEHIDISKNIKKEEALKNNLKGKNHKKAAITTTNKKTGADIKNIQAQTKKEPIKIKDEENSMISDKIVLKFFESENSEIFFQVLSTLKNFNASSENSMKVIKSLQIQTLDFPEEFEAFKLLLKSTSNLKEGPDEPQIYELKILYEQALLSIMKDEKPLESLPVRKIGNFLRNNEKEESNDLKRLELENKGLKELIMNTPKNPTRLDFEILERKLELVERAYKQKEFEISVTLQNMKNPYMKNSSESQTLRLELISVKNQMERERKEFEESLRRKNKEIETFKEELNELLGEIQSLKA